jgi:hypothetical protein
VRKLLAATENLGQTTVRIKGAADILLEKIAEEYEYQ